MKRFKAAILTFTMFVGIISTFAGCAASNEKTTVKLSTWLAMINETFGMNDYQSESPLISSVRRSDDCFDNVQIAAEWNVVKEEDRFNPDEVLTAEYAAVTLSRVADLSGGEDQTIKNESKLIYPTEVKAAVKAGLFTLKNGKFKQSLKLTPEEAQTALDNAYDKWANQTFESVCEYDVAENTVDMTDGGVNSINYSYDPVENKVILPIEYYQQMSNLKEGGTYILPTGDNIAVPTAFKAESINIFDDFVEIINSDEEVEVERIIENLDLQNTEKPDLLSGGYIVDGNGSKIYYDEFSAESTSFKSGPTVQNLLSHHNDLQVNPTSGKMKKMNFSTKIGGLSVSADVSGESMSVTVNGNLSKGIDVSYSQQFKDFSLSYDYEYEWFKLKKAYLRLDYTTVEERKISFNGNKIASEALSKVKVPSGNSALSSLIGKAQDVAESGSKAITLFYVPMVNVYGVGIDLEVKFSVTVNGEIKMTITTAHQEGFEFNGSSFKVIKSSSEETEFFAQGKLTATVSFGLVLTFLSIRLADVTVNFGVGCIVTAQVFITQNNNLEAQADKLDISATVLGSITAVGDFQVTSCFDIYSYMILKITAGDNSILGKIKKLTYDVWTKDNRPIKALCCHWEDGHKVDKCTRNFKEKEEESTQTAEEETSSYYLSQSIELNSFFVSLAQGDSTSIEVLSLPNGYIETDLVWTSSNNKNVVVDSSGKINGINGGNSTITVKTRDGKYSAVCSVNVATVEKTTYDLLPT